MESKMRIKLYSEDEKELLSDRLVEQSTEFSIGPKNKHKGPLVIEVNLKDQQDVESLKTYLDKLTGDLPLQKKSVKIPSGKGTIELDTSEPQEELIKKLLDKSNTQDELVKHLREHDFRFFDTETIAQLVPELTETVEIKEKHEGYQWMLRMVKEAKDPRNDKFDYRIMVGIKIVGKRKEKVQVYLFGKYAKTYTKPWESEKKINFKKVKQLMVFPEFMDYEDRKKWRVEHRKVQNNPNHKQSKFYTKSLPFIKMAD